MANAGKEMKQRGAETLVAITALPVIASIVAFVWMISLAVQTTARRRRLAPFSNGVILRNKD